MISIDVLRLCLPNVKQDNFDLYADHLVATCEEFQINTNLRLAGFLSQVGHESADFHYVKENLNYSAEGLIRVFPKYFRGIDVSSYARNPQAIASRVYANRMGNGDEDSGDGWKYRGRGLIQLTGCNNYVACGEGLGLDLISNPEYLETSEGATRSAAWFWSVNRLNDIADTGDIELISRRVNGGTIGLRERIDRYEYVIQVLTTNNVG